MPQDPYIREKFTKSATPRVGDHYERFPRKHYQTEVESWRELQSPNIEFAMRAVAGADR